MKNIVNRQVVLTSRPDGIPTKEHFDIIESAVPSLAPGSILVRNVYLSVEPAMRGWVSAIANYSEPVPIGGVMRSFATGRVVESEHPDYVSGDIVTGMFGWQDYAAVEAKAIQRKVSPDLPMSTSLGVLGINGLTAYFALLDKGEPRPGDMVVVSTAAGAVGSCLGQIARMKGCKTVGITSSPDKVSMCVSEFGYDEAIDYQTENLDSALAQYCPDGVDIYHDNTAGRISDSVIQHINVGARIVICGTASIPSWDPAPEGPRVERSILVKRARMEGFLVFDYADRYEEALSVLSDWVRSGKLRYREDIADGIEHAPGAIASLYRSENLGKKLVRIAEDH